MVVCEKRGGLCGGFMSHRGWQWGVRLRTLIDFNCRDVRNSVAKDGKGVEKIIDLNRSH